MAGENGNTRQLSLSLEQYNELTVELSAARATADLVSQFLIEGDMEQLQTGTLQTVMLRLEEQLGGICGKFSSAVES